MVLSTAALHYGRPVLPEKAEQRNAAGEATSHQHAVATRHHMSRSARYERYVTPPLTRLPVPSHTGIVTRSVTSAGSACGYNPAARRDALTTAFSAMSAQTISK